MTFNSLAFVFFLPLVYLLCRLIPRTSRWVLLLLASYLFYCFVTPWFGLLLLFTTAVDFFAALKIEQASNLRSKKSWLILSLGANLGVLLAFKYSAFFANCGILFSNRFLQMDYSLFRDIIVPAGLSFYTFQSMSYTIDVYRGKEKAQRHFGLFALFVSFFPHLVAGPVQRHSELAPQLKQPEFPAPDSIFPYLRLIIWGFFKKLVIADNIARITDPIYRDLSMFSGSVVLFAGFLFTVQLYADFSGYTDIATGVARLFGVDFTINWKRPLLSRSVYSYWKRHHISITSWFREYVYFSLGGDRKGKWRWVLNISLVFLLSGLWHGARLTFVVWGALHAIAYLSEYFLSKRLKIQLPAFAGWFLTLLFLSFSYLAFRCTSTQVLLHSYRNMFSGFFSAPFLSQLHSVTDWFPLVICLAGVAVLFLKETMEELNVETKLFVRFRPVFYWLVFFAIFLVGDFSNREFIYFKF